MVNSGKTAYVFNEYYYVEAKFMILILSTSQYILHISMVMLKIDLALHSLLWAQENKVYKFRKVHVIMSKQLA